LALANASASREDHRAMLKSLVGEAYAHAITVTNANRVPNPDLSFAIRKEFVKQLMVSIDRAVELSAKRDLDFYQPTLSKIAEMQLFDSRSTVA